MCRPLLIACLSLTLAATAVAQDGAVVSLVTDKEVYEYGETIELQYIVENTGEETFEWWGSSNCLVGFAWGDFVHPGESGGCTLDDRPFFFPPGSVTIFTWTIVPSEHAVPAADGLHEAVAGRGILFDPGTIEGAMNVASTTFEAPLYLGGRVSVRLADGVDLDDVADVMASLNAEVIEAYGNWYIWEIEGTTVPDATDFYGDDERFQMFEIWREIYYFKHILSTEPGGALAEAGLSAPFPNPASSSVRLELLPPSDGPVLVELLDLQGRRVALMHEGSLQAGQVVTITLDAPHLAAGSYVVRALGEGFTFSRPLTIVR